MWGFEVLCVCDFSIWVCLLGVSGNGFCLNLFLGLGFLFFGCVICCGRKKVHSFELNVVYACNV